MPLPEDNHWHDKVFSGHHFMKRKVDTKDLQIGMYVSELDRSWLETPFLFQGLLITSQGDINELARYCKFVFVDEERSEYQRPEAPSAKQIETAAVKLTQVKYEKPAPKIAIEEEIAQARQVKEFTEQQVALMYSQSRVGQTFDYEQAHAVVVVIIESLIRNPDAMLLLGSIRSHEQEAETHAINSCILALALGRYMKFSQKMVEELGLAALLHDVGEVRIPIEVLHATNRTPEQTALVKRHVDYGVEILRNTPDIPDSIIDAAYSHHEQVDGKGYPRGVSGDAMTIFAKIVAIIDVYDKLTRGGGEKCMSSTEALRYLYIYRNRIFDAKLTEAFIQCLGIYPVGSLVELDSGEVGIVISSLPGEHLSPRLMLVRGPDKRPYEPPRLLNLALFAKGGEGKGYAIRQVLPPDAYGVDMRSYLLNENLI
jgi:HD-GYP domain-containing protein (c-di-GMP phosphodiesterase class II)